MALEKEIQTYNEKLPELLGDIGKFVLIHEDKVIGVFAAYEDAIKSGYEKFSLEPFLVRQILATEQIHQITRFTACPTSAAK